MSGCLHGFDADDVARAVRGEAMRDGAHLTADHLATCAACRTEWVVLETARDAWGGARDDDDRSRAVFRQRRLVHGIPRPRSRAAWGTFARVAVAAVILVVAVLRPWRHLPPAPVASSASPVVVTSAPHPLASASSSASPSLPLLAARSSAEPVVVVRGSSGSISPAVHAGDRLPRKVHVGAQARLRLAWSFALEDVAEIAGPADLAVVGEPASSLRVEEGHAIVSSDSDFEICTTEARMRGRGATWDLDVGAGWTHVHARAGVVTLRARERESILHPGEETRVAGDENRVPGAAPKRTSVDRGVAPAPSEELDPATEFAQGVAALGAGDRAEAAERFRHVADAPRASDGLRDRAAFRWAELALARGETDRARTELTGLLAAADPALAADAAFLLARSAGTPGERADVWRRYLARGPTTPYRQDAILEEAAALLASGRKTEADTALDDLWTDPALTKVQGDRLRSLSSQIRR